jgi:hypothetical protein
MINKTINFCLHWQSSCELPIRDTDVNQTITNPPYKANKMKQTYLRTDGVWRYDKKRLLVILVLQTSKKRQCLNGFPKPTKEQHIWINKKNMWISIILYKEIIFFLSFWRLVWLIIITIIMLITIIIVNNPCCRRKKDAWISNNLYCWVGETLKSFENERTPFRQPELHYFYSRIGNEANWVHRADIHAAHHLRTEAGFSTPTQNKLNIKLYTINK